MIQAELCVAKLGDHVSFKQQLARCCKNMINCMVWMMLTVCHLASSDYTTAIALTKIQSEQQPVHTLHAMTYDACIESWASSIVR